MSASNAYSMFYRSHLHKSEYTDLTHDEFQKMVKTNWDNLSQTERDTWQENALKLNKLHESQFIKIPRIPRS